MASITSPRPASGAALRLRRLCLVALAAAALVTCTGEPTSPSRPGVGTLRVTPYFDAFARLVPLTLDNVRVIVVRPPSDVLLTATRSFTPGTQQLTLSLPVLLQSTSEALQVTLELYAGTTLLFSGTSTVQVAAGGTTAPASVPVVYQGPGATLTTLTLAPRDTTVSLGASFPFTATALDAQQANVPQFYVSWSADNGSIDAAGSFTAPGVRDTVMVHGVTPNGVEDSTRVIVAAAPSTLTKVGGDGQSGIVGTRLAQPLAVQVNGTDGQPVPGAVVAFTVTTGGGSVDSALATSDAQGIARSGAVLGPTVGSQSFTATVSGIPAAVFTATATGVAPIVVTLAAGGNHTCEIRGTQTLCWGDNSTGQLGDGTTTDRAVPGPVATAQTFVSLALGDGHSCALTAAGQAFCWGENFSGSLGNGTTNPSPTPVAVSGGRMFVALTAGEEFTCGLTAGGQAFCWGYNFDGQLGDGGNSDQLVPVAVTGGLSFASIDAGTDHTCALTATGQVFCWGSNFDGQLGDGTQSNRNVPTAVTGGLTFTAIHAGFNFSCGIATGGGGFCWGINFGLQLTSPQPVAGGFTYTAIAGGDNHICGLTTGGWRCGGDNGSGQLGDGTTTDRVAPVLPSGGFTFTTLAGGSQHTCGRTATATLCWGSNSAGQLGDGTNTNQLTPTLSVGPAVTTQVSAGNGQTASAGTAVSIAPAIIVNDGIGNPVPGLDVIFAVTSGGGSVTGAVTQTDALGIATVGSWTLGATPGSNTLSATVQVGGVGGNPVGFTATGTSPSVLTWDGSASTVWTDPNNWTPAAVPTSGQDVVIPSGTPNQPNVTTTANTQSLIIQSGATLTLTGSFTFNVFGDFDNSGLITVASGTPTIDLRGTTRTMRGNSPAATSVSGTYSLIGAVTVANSFSISGGTSGLTVGGQGLIVGSLAVGSGGSLFMTNAADLVVVSGNLTMGGSDHTGKLTAGQIQVQGNFLQSSGGSPNSFVATGSHAVIMTGAASTVTFQSPGTAASRFNRLLFGAGTFTGATSSLASRVVVGESAFINSGTLTLAGHTLEVVSDFVVVQNTGSRLVMTNALDSLLVGGNATFDGENELTFMSAGVLVLGGDLTQLATISPDAFHPSGTHKTVLTGSDQTLSFATPGLVPGSSHFQSLDWTGTGTVTLASDVFSHGAFQSLGAGASTIASINHVLDVGGFSAAGPVTFNGTALRLSMPSGGPLALDNLTFQNMSSTVNQLEVLHPGTGGPFTFSTFIFSSVPTTGFYLQVTDTDGASPDALTIDLTNPTPASDGGFSQALNGAVINWPSTAPIKTWTGATQDWHTNSNWSPAGVPTATDDVTIPVTANQPILSAPGAVRDLTVQTGVILNLNSFALAVGGNVSAPSATSFIGGGGVLQLNGAGKTISGTLSVALSVTVTGTYSLAGRTTIGTLTVSGSGNLAMNGQTLVTGAALNTTGSGTITMTNALDSLLVSGSATFDGANLNGLLTAGTFILSGNMTNGGSSGALGAFQPSGTHLTKLTGSTLQTMLVQAPATIVPFAYLDISGAAGGIALDPAVSLFGTFEIMTSLSGGPPIVITGNNTQFINPSGVAVDGLVVNGPHFLIGNPGRGIVQFDNVTFQNQSPTIAQLSVSHPGQVAPYVFNNLTFTVTPTGAGLYLDAITEGAPTPGLTLDLVNPTPATSGGFIRVQNGAVINWPTAAPAAFWTGTVSADWHTPGNWSTGSVPTAANDVTIGSGTPNAPVLSAPAAVGALSVQSTATLDLGGFTLTVNGLLDVLGASVTGAAGSRIVMTGTTVGMQGSASVDLTISGSATLFNTFTLGGSLLLQGSLNLNGASLFISGDLVTQGASALIRMQNGGEALNVAGNATFDGGNQLGSMSTGAFLLGGNLTQLNTHSGDSFHPSGGHVTILMGTAHTLSFATPGDVPGTSHFQQVQWLNSGTLTLGSDVYAHDAFTFGAGTGSNTVISVGRQLSVGRVVMSSAAAVFDNTQLVINQPSGALPIDFDHVTFQNMNTTVTQLSVLHTGAGGPFLFSDMTFGTTPTGGGLYLLVTDTDGGAPLTIDMANPNPGTSGGFAQVANGAVINWPAGGPVIVWNGSVDSDWFNTANWNGGVVPGAADNVLIPSGMPNYPDAPNISMKDLTVQSGATLSTSDHTITVGGNLDASGTITGCCQITMTGTGVTARGNLDGYTFQVLAGAVVSLNGSLTVGGLFNDRIEIDGGELIINGQTAVADQLSTLNGGLLTMTGPTDQVNVDQAFFSGGDETGRLTAGILTTRILQQTVGTSGHATSFFAGGNHVTTLNGASAGSVSFQSPASSRFEDLLIDPAIGSVDLASNVTVAGLLRSTALFQNGATIGTSAPGSVLTAGGANTVAAGGFTALTMDGVPLVLSGGAGVSLSDVTFQNQNPLGTHLTVNNVGLCCSISIVLANLNFTTGLSAGGFYIVANDLDGPSPDPLTIDVVGSNPASGAGVSQANNGAIINWPAAAPGTITWGGTAGTDWFNAANWVGGVVPGTFDNVFIGVTANQPVLTNNASVNDLSMQSGTTLEIADFVLVLSGNVDLAGTIDDITGTGNGGVTVTGSGTTLQGTMNTTVAVVGNSTMNSNLITGDLSLSGSLIVGANFLGVQGVLATIGGGTLAMNHVSGQVQVSGDAVFNGGSTNGLLTAGILTIGGDFIQVGSNSTQSFAADPGHATVLSGNPANITFTTPGPTASHFGDLRESGFGATFNLNSNVTVLGALSGGDGFGGTMVGTSCPVVLTVGNYFTSGPLNLDCVQLVVDDPAGVNTFFGGISFTNMPTDVTQLTIQHPGVSAGNLDLGFMSFVQLNTGDTGFYVAAVETTPGAPPLVVNLVTQGTNVTNGASFTTTSGGASVLWP